MAGLAELAALARVLAELGPGCGWLRGVVSHPFAMKLRMDGAQGSCELCELR